MVLKFYILAYQEKVRKSDKNKFFEEEEKVEHQEGQQQGGWKNEPLFP